MYQDAKTMFATELAYGGTPSVVNLKHAKMGPGRRLRIQFNGDALADATGFELLDGATSSPSDDLATFVFTAAELNEGVTISVPETVAQYLTIALTGTATAGTYTAGLALEEGQTNR